MSHMIHSLSNITYYMAVGQYPLHIWALFARGVQHRRSGHFHSARPSRVAGSAKRQDPEALTMPTTSCSTTTVRSVQRSSQCTGSPVSPHGTGQSDRNPGRPPWRQHAANQDFSWLSWKGPQHTWKLSPKLIAFVSARLVRPVSAEAKAADTTQVCDTARCLAWNFLNLCLRKFTHCFQIEGHVQGNVCVFWVSHKRHYKEHIRHFQQKVLRV